MSSIIKTNKKITVEEAIGELYPFENLKAEKVELLCKPKTEYQKYLRSKNNIVVNHDIHYPAEIQQKEYHLFLREEIGNMFQKNYGKQQEPNVMDVVIDILQHTRDWMKRMFL